MFLKRRYLLHTFNIITFSRADTIINELDLDLNLFSGPPLRSSFDDDERTWHLFFLSLRLQLLEQDLAFLLIVIPTLGWDGWKSICWQCRGQNLDSLIVRGQEMWYETFCGHGFVLGTEFLFVHASPMWRGWKWTCDKLSSMAACVLVWKLPWCKSQKNETRSKQNITHTNQHIVGEVTADGEIDFLFRFFACQPMFLCYILERSCCPLWLRCQEIQLIPPLIWRANRDQVGLGTGQILFKTWCQPFGVLTVSRSMFPWTPFKHPAWISLFFFWALSQVDPPGFRPSLGQLRATTTYGRERFRKIKFLFSQWIPLPGKVKWIHTQIPCANWQLKSQYCAS